MTRFPNRQAKLLIILAGLVMGQTACGDTLVRTQDEYAAAVANAQPGDTIVLANGVWRDFEILFQGEGTEDAPITLTAETKGEVILSGQSNLRLAGRHLVVSGLVFRDGHSPTNTVIAFRRTRGDLAYHSRVTEVVIDNYNNPERFEVDFWVMLYGQHNRFDHNHLVGKSNQGVTMAVRLDSEESRENHHRIDHNYFGPRSILGSNGGETFRIGTSHYSLSDSNTLVENNYFDRCNGEVEIISSKSGANIFRGNVFYESRGTLTLRHGNNNLIENNVFLGNGADHTGGIRVINAGQTVRNNYMYGLTGHRFGGGFVVMNGVPNSPINRYHQVDGAVIENNSIIEIDHFELAAGSDEERSAPPINSAFRSNLIYNANGENVIAVHDDVSGIEFQNNLLNNVEEPAISSGFESADVRLVEGDNGLLYPDDQAFADVGAARDLSVLSRSDTGVSWYPKPGYDDRFDTGDSVEIDSGLDTLVAGVATAEAGGVVSLAAGDYLVTRSITIDKPVTIRGNGSVRIEYERTALFEIVDGGSLKIEGVTITGAASPDVAGNSVIRTSRYSMLKNYELIVTDTVVEDLDTNHSFHFFSIAKHTFADRIEIRDSSFTNVTGNVLALNLETDDLGIYNAEYITIAGSTFTDVDGAIADIYRGGTDESTFGPQFTMTQSTVRESGGGSRNRARASIRLHGVQAVNISANEFIDSRPMRVMETVGEPVTRIHDNRLIETDDTVIDQWVRPQ